MDNTNSLFPFPERLKMKTYNEDGEIITEWDEEKGWFEDGTEFTEYGEQIMNRIYHPYTEEQFAEIQLEKEKSELIASRQPMTAFEVIGFFVRAQINTVEIPDKTSLRMMDFYPTFSEIIGRTVKQGFKFVHENKLYKTAQADLLIQSQYLPGTGTESLYIRIDLEHTGKKYDPIPYDGNMILENGKYYSQNNALYLCNRDTVTAVHHELADLVGLYVSAVST